MFVPFISKSSSVKLFRRKGGGGRGGSSTGSAPRSGSSKTGSISSSSGKLKTTTYGRSGSATSSVIPAGQPFAGRSTGGGTRANIFGSRTYGSGYAGVAGRGTAGRNFPFVYWPIVWPLGIGGGTAYLHSSEYGEPNNSSRPGGPMAYATFPSSSNSTIFRLLSDNSTIASLINDLSTNCTSYLSTSSQSPNSLSNAKTGPTPYVPPYTFSNTTGPANPQPQQVVQYYRASTIALTLDSYNNSATYSAVDGTPDSPLPALSQRDAALLNCLNETIGLAAPLISGARMEFPMTSLFWFWILWWLWALI